MSHSILIATIIILIFKPCFFYIFKRNIISYTNYKSNIAQRMSITSNAPLKVLLLQFDCSEIDSDEISELLLELGSLSVSVEVVNEKKDYLNDELNWNDLVKTKSWATALLKANFPTSFNINGVIDIVKSIYNNQMEFYLDDLVDKDWISEVQKDWKPQIIGDLTIKFPWHSNISQITSNELILEGGAAFGTGDHPTTRLCCKWLNNMIGEIKNKKLDNISLLDYGCGSGILGLASLKYGVNEAYGVDIDKDALISANNNCIINNLPMKLFITSTEDKVISYEESSILMNNLRGNAPNTINFPTEDSINNKFDITIANILAPILISSTPKLAEYTKSGGYIGLSGLVLGQEDKIIKEYSQYFNDLKIHSSENDWILIVGKRK